MIQISCYLTMYKLSKITIKKSSTYKNLHLNNYIFKFQATMKFLSYPRVYYKMFHITEKAISYPENWSTFRKKKKVITVAKIERLEV